ncbi:MAG: hypothetical protein KDD43_00550, partial [Bdellovibrionales bacterium]|nr:hypothetical protein [Bdellovibrionales bacterium]
FAPIGSASPYGWHRDCSYLSSRETVAGGGFDNDSGAGITDLGSCGSYVYNPDAQFPNELPWDQGDLGTPPPYLKIQHYHDGIVDFSCHQRHIHQLRAHGYLGREIIIKPEGALRSPNYHNFFLEFQEPLLEFFLSFEGPVESRKTRPR